ncbi:hypothetical protein [Microlunatus soli]|uniref:hypothetical protein n=1 Tax=Microlunatus soli TaxID=630515 RepID=UPI0015614B40|nr:hypothetical protein [Microlunatus soli]
MTSKKKPSVKVLIAVLVILVAGGFVPIAQFVETRFLGPQTRTATVREVGYGYPGHASRAGGRSVAFVLPDGHEGAVWIGSRLIYPKPGDTIEVYWTGDRWRSPEQYSWGSAVGGFGAGAFCILLVVGWFVMRHRGRFTPSRPR